MGFEITDGTGKGNSVGVTSNNRILTSTISENQFQYAAEEGLLQKKPILGHLICLE
jgi:hypothetical protein